MADKAWFKYTDESGNCWRIKTTAELAEIGGLVAAATREVHPLPKHIEARYVWLQEWPRPTDRLSARQKVIIEHDRLEQIWGKEEFELSGRKLRARSYYGEVMGLE